MRGWDLWPSAPDTLTAPFRAQRSMPILCIGPVFCAMAGSCASESCEPGQGRKTAALSEPFVVPQVAWLSRSGPDPLLRFVLG